MLSISATILVSSNQLIDDIIISIWKTSFLLILSLWFHLIFCFSPIYSEKYIFYLKTTSPVLFWLLTICIPIYILVVISLFFIFINIHRKYDTFKFKFSINQFLIPLLYFIIIGSEAWNMHRHPLPLNYLITQSATGSDLTFYSAISSVLKSYNTCSIGVDGLANFPYHYGTYFF